MVGGLAEIAGEGHNRGAGAVDRNISKFPSKKIDPLFVTGANDRRGADMDIEHWHPAVVLDDSEAGDFDGAVNIGSYLVQHVSVERDIVAIVADEGCRGI